MSRSRLVLLFSMSVVVVGVVAGLGALWFDSARAAVGPLTGEGLTLPADTRFLIGIDVQRFVSSPFWERYGTQEGMRPKGLRDLEEKTGLDPARDVEQVVMAGSGPVGSRTRPLLLAVGRFDPARIGETAKSAGGASVRELQGVPLYTFSASRAGGTPEEATLAVLDRGTLLFGPTAKVEETVASRARGEVPLRQNTQLLGLVEKVKPGFTFWMVGDRTLLEQMPKAIPAPGAGGSGGAGASMALPPLEALTVTGDLDPQVSLAIVGQAVDDASATKLADVVRGLVALVSLQAQQKPELQQLTSAISVATEANRVLVSARLPYEMIDALRPKPAPKAEESAGEHDEPPDPTAPE